MASSMTMTWPGTGRPSACSADGRANRSRAALGVAVAVYLLLTTQYVISFHLRQVTTLSDDDAKLPVYTSAEVREMREAEMREATVIVTEKKAELASVLRQAVTAARGGAPAGGLPAAGGMGGGLALLRECLMSNIQPCARP